MNVKDMKPKHWAIVASVLLVLVISLSAYYVIVPKVKELTNLQGQLAVVGKARDKQLKIPVPAKVTEDDKKELALKVPVQEEQSRFLKLIREQEKNSGVTIKSISFIGDDTSTDLKTADAKPQAKDKKDGVLSELSGKISLEGDYKQVRAFIEKFSNMQRLVTYTKWNMSTSEKTMTDVSLTPKPGTGTTGMSIPAPPQIPTQPVSQKIVDDSVLTDPLLKDRTPLYTQQEYDRLVESITAKAATMLDQHDKDLANLEIQQAANRLKAGLDSKKQADSLLTQEQATVFLPGANPDIRAVLGLPPINPPALAPAKAPHVGATSTNESGLPLSFLDSLQSMNVSASNLSLGTTVKLDIDFTTYYVPTGSDILPELQAIQKYQMTYEQTERTNPVEPQ